MRDIIFRDDCDLNAPSLDRDEMIWDLIYEMGIPDSLENFNFGVALLEHAQNIIDTAPALDPIAYKCPECHTVSILYKEDEFCPVCGIAREY